MSIPTETNLYTDLSDLSRLRHQAKQTPQDAIKAVAKQYESLFIKMMLKSMREASMGDPIFDSDQSKFYRDMFDNQLALTMGNGKGIGLAEALERQFKHYVPPSAGEVSKDKPPAVMRLPQKETKPVVGHSQVRAVTGVASFKATHAVSHIVPEQHATRNAVDQNIAFESPKEFVEKLWPLAEKAGDRLGLEPAVLVAQAALETGWGRYVSHDESGKSSFNLFNIKAGKHWDGNSVTVNTVEFMGGNPVNQVARFRAYESFAESFNDYVEFLKESPRYKNALEQGADADSFIRELHSSGFATDPDYADKILHILEREAPLFERLSEAPNSYNNEG